MTLYPTQAHNFKARTNDDCTMDSVKYRTRSHLLEEQLKEKALLALKKQQECNAMVSQSYREERNSRSARPSAGG
jgi:hypothetical protein